MTNKFNYCTITNEKLEEKKTKIIFHKWKLLKILYRAMLGKQYMILPRDETYRPECMLSRVCSLIRRRYCGPLELQQWIKVVKSSIRNHFKCDKISLETFNCDIYIYTLNFKQCIIF